MVGKNRIWRSALGRLTFVGASGLNLLCLTGVLPSNREDLFGRMTNVFFPQKTPGSSFRALGEISLRLLAEPRDQPAEERAEAEESEQGQRRSRLRQSVSIALALVCGIGVLICACSVRVRLRAGGRLIRVSAACRAASRVLRVLIGGRSSSRSCAALSVLIGRAGCWSS